MPTGMDMALEPEPPGVCTNSSSIAAPGIAMIVGAWLYGLMMPAHGAYCAIKHKDFRLLGAWVALNFAKRIPRDSVVFEPFRIAYRTLFSLHFTDVEWLTPSLLLNKDEKPQVTIAGPHGLFSLALMRTQPARGSKTVMFVDNTLVTLNPFIGKWE